MTARATTYERRFMRNADKALLGGVCAGIADYFGFNLRVTRLLVAIACLVWTPVTLLSYIAVVLLVPARSDRYGYEERLHCRRRRRARRETRRERREREAEARRMEANAVDRRCRSLDERLATIEKYVTSSRFELDSEFRNL
jgi:phage shock protein C